jgi:hypothetical protein
LDDMTRILGSTQSSLRQRLIRRQRERWPQLTDLRVRFRNPFAYVDGVLPDVSTSAIRRPGRELPPTTTGRRSRAHVGGGEVDPGRYPAVWRVRMRQITANRSSLQCGWRRSGFVHPPC